MKWHEYIDAVKTLNGGLQKREDKELVLTALAHELWLVRDHATDAVIKNNSNGQYNFLLEQIASIEPHLAIREKVKDYLEKQSSVSLPYENAELAVAV